MNKVKKYDSYTLGNSPACIYLIDVLNNSTQSIDHSVLKVIHEFRSTFKELVKAFDANIITQRTMLSVIRSKTIELELKATELMDKGIDPLIVNLTKNVIASDYTIFRRQQEKINRISNSAIARAKSLLKNKKSPFPNQELLTFGKVNKISEEKLDTLVIFNEYGLPSVKMDKENIPDHRTNEYLMEKSIKRLDRLGKSKTLYTNLEKK